MHTSISTDVLNNAMKVLGIEENLDELNSEILNKNYRQMALQNHPDKVGKDDASVQEQAHIKMGVINASKDILTEYLNAKNAQQANDAVKTERRDETSFDTSPREDKRNPHPHPQSPSAVDTAVSTLILVGGIGVFTMSPAALIAAAVVVQAAFSGVAVAVLLANVHSYNKYKRTYEFGDLLLNDIGRKISRKEDYKVGDGLRSVIGFFRSTPSTESKTKDENTSAQNPANA